MTIPGIDYLTALTIISEIVDVKRFSTPLEARSVRRSRPFKKGLWRDEEKGRDNKAGFEMSEVRHG
ncbi:MAG: transposase [Rhabdochlamydiaceae bacterium]